MNMLQFVPKGLSPAKNGGLYAATVAGLWSPEIGDGSCSALSEERLALQGKYKFLGKEGPFSISVVLTGQGRADIGVGGMGTMRCSVKQDGSALLYEVLDGALAGATVKQTFKEQDWSAGAYVQLDIHSDELRPRTGTSFLAVKCWFHKW